MSLATPIPDAESGSDTPSGLSRRGLIRNAAGAGAAGLAAGALLSAATGIAAAAEPADATAHAAAEHAPAGAEETLIVHVRDARTGQVDIFHGHRHRTVTDRALTAALLRAAG
ncbi:hypothetical protein ACEZCY_32935 [Streptacidiphilus sp. N1-12]|uniref:Tat (Twin-arginine translocation) pathway signal sequence n=2 Tax=Streptacidiphilus alkalitolerans TaxID=3342712 RepID=A0ABV6VJS0_9ACTN